MLQLRIWGAELGATTSVFPSDEVTKDFLKKQQREEDWVEIVADEDAIYDKVIEIDLTTLEPMIAMPHSPDNVLPISEVLGLRSIKLPSAAVPIPLIAI